MTIPVSPLTRDPRPLERPLDGHTVTARYPRGRLAGEIALGGGGALVMIVILAAARSWTAAAIFGPMAVLFGLYLLLMLRRLGQTIVADATGVRIQGQRALAWAELGGLRLRYYATRRQRADGWFVLSLRQRALPGRRPGPWISLESSLESFEPIAKQAAAEAVARQVPLDDITVDNLLALDIRVPSSPGVEPDGGASQSTKA